MNGIRPTPLLHVSVADSHSAQIAKAVRCLLAVLGQAPLLAFLLLLAIPVWAGGGTVPAWQGSFLALSGWAWGTFLLFRLTQRGNQAGAKSIPLLADPALYGSLVFLALLALQAWNAPRMRVFDFDVGRWAYSPPPRPGLPFSFLRHEAIEMFRWFVPVFSVYLIPRQGRFRFDVFWNLLAIQGLFNAALAFFHLHAGWVRMYDRFQMGDKVFGSFGYPNHGAMYFLLLLGLSTGLVLRELRKDGSERSIGTLILHALCALAFASAACLSTSRAGLLGTFLFLFGIMAYMIGTGWRRTHPVQKIHGFLGMAGFMGLCAAIFLVFAGDRHFKEVKAATEELDPQKEFNARFFQTRAAWAMWKDHRLTGVGPWGYKWLAADYHPPEEWKWLRVGKANVHNDYMQFLAEFGLVGISALLLVLGTAIVPTLKSMLYKASDPRSLWADPARVCMGLAMCIVALDALIDLPFRSPAVFMHFALFLSFLSLPNPQDSLWPPPIDWNLLSPPGVNIRAKKRKKRAAEPSGP